MINKDVIVVVMLKIAVHPTQNTDTEKVQTDAFNFLLSTDVVFWLSMMHSETVSLCN